MSDSREISLIDGEDEEPDSESVTFLEFEPNSTDDEFSSEIMESSGGDKYTNLRITDNCNDSSWFPPMFRGRPAILWMFAVIEIAMGFIIGMMLMKYMWNTPIPGLLDNWYFAALVVWMTTARVIIQTLTGLLLLMGLKSCSQFVTVRAIKEWLRGAYFVFFEQFVSLCITITKNRGADLDEYEPTGLKRAGDLWGNTMDIVYHVFAFFVIRIYFIQNWKSRSRSARRRRRDRRRIMEVVGGGDMGRRRTRTPRPTRL